MNRLSLNARYLAFLLFVTGLFLTLLYFKGNPAAPEPETRSLRQITAFDSGKYDASGLVEVVGAGGVLFVDNKRKGQVFFMRLDPQGKQTDSIKALDLGVNIEDLEALTTDETHFYSISSQSKSKAIAGAGIVRFRFDHQNQSVSDVDSIGGLKKFLTENVAELRELGDTKGKDGGVNIEGLAWDSKNKRFLLGLRSPVIDGQALLVPLKMRDSSSEFSIDNLEVEKAIRLPLGGSGIRGIEYNRLTDHYQLISGAAEDQDQADFGIWEWNGSAEEPVVREINKFDKTLKPEGIAQVTVGERDFTLVVFDASGYTVLD